jgi:hypothetical protein
MREQSKATSVTQYINIFTYTDSRPPVLMETLKIIPRTIFSHQLVSGPHITFAILGSGVSAADCRSLRLCPLVPAKVSTIASYGRGHIASKDVYFGCETLVGRARNA